VTERFLVPETKKSRKEAFMNVIMFVIEFFLAATGVFYCVANCVINLKERKEMYEDELMIYARIVTIFSLPVLLHTIAALLLLLNIEKSGAFIMEIRFVLPFVLAALYVVYLGTTDIICFHKFPVDRSRFVDPQVADPKR
jgi:hypothetical protein